MYFPCRFQGFFGWINADKIFFARTVAGSAAYVVETIQNATDVVVSDSSLQMDKRGDEKKKIIKLSLSC